MTIWMAKNDGIYTTENRYDENYNAENKNYEQ